MTERPRVVIGAGPEQEIPARVCESSARRRSSRELEVIHAYHLRVPQWRGGRNPTPFSYVRLWVPELCGRQGRAIYLDSDMLVLADITELWDMPMGDHHVLATPNPSVLLIDCAVDWDVHEILRKLESGEWRYQDAVNHLGRLPPERLGSLPEEWNDLDRYRPGKTRLLHYTDLRRQPWVYPGHPLGHLWYSELDAMLEERLILEEEIPESIRDLRATYAATRQVS